MSALAGAPVMQEGDLVGAAAELAEVMQDRHNLRAFRPHVIDETFYRGRLDLCHMIDISADYHAGSNFG